LEQFIQGLPDGHAKTSWQHTFAAGERASWREYTVLFTGDANEIRLALKRLEGVAEKLTALYVHTVDEVAIPATGEHGFKGHPAETRLRRQLSYLYANLGYARAQLGEAEQAVADYSRALSYVHESGVRSHRAMTLNNLARVLSDLGRDHQALRLCLDALAMRKEIGADQPIGLSHSTLALILNDHNNPDRSWVEASKALVYFQRVGDTRGIGLADMQLCEGLRRMAAQANFGRAFPATREELYSAAEEAADEALGIFILGEPNETERKEGKVKEPVRWIEVRIEKGCLHRDRVSYLRSKESAAWQGQYNKALGLLEEAARYAGEKGWRRAQLDATLNIAWTHYYAEKPDLDAKKLEHDFPKTRAALERVMLLIAEITGKPGEPVTPGQPLPKPREHPSYLYFQLSKLHGLSGRMALDIFSNWVLNFTRDQVRHPGVDPKEIRPKIHREIYEIIKSDPHGLDVAAAAYLHGVCYAQLYAPQSISLTYLQDTLFSYVAEFNQEELLAFTEFLRGHALWEPHQKLLPADTASLEAFLRDTVGIPNQTAGRGGHSL
jgi:tetratricopeptide (TPR) repeat protein